MLRLIARNFTRVIGISNLMPLFIANQKCSSRSISNAIKINSISSYVPTSNLLFNRWINPAENTFLQPKVSPQEAQPVRTVTKFSLQKAKRKSVKAVVKRFKRLDWGIWIRTHSGRNKKLFKKSPPLKRRLRQHIFTNATQSYLLDKMVTSFWRRPKYYINDPYEPYHKRDEYYATKGKTFKV